MDKQTLLQNIISALPNVEEETLEKIAAILRLEGKRTLREVLKEIAEQYPSWRFDDETTRNIAYWDPMQFGEYYRHYLDYPAQLHLHPQEQSKYKIIPDMPATLEFLHNQRIVLVPKEQEHEV